LDWVDGAVELTPQTRQPRRPDPDGLCEALSGIGLMRVNASATCSGCNIRLRKLTIPPSDPFAVSLKQIKLTTPHLAAVRADCCG
jgi:hypothetical protein